MLLYIIVVGLAVLVLKLRHEPWVSFSFWIPAVHEVDFHSRLLNLCDLVDAAVLLLQLAIQIFAAMFCKIFNLRWHS